MKGNAKKVAVFVSVVAIAMFIAVPMASAHDSWWKMLIRGEYAFTGSGACLIGGSVGPNTWEGVYTFNYNGTGKMEALNRFVETANPAVGGPAAGSANISWEFTYEMDGPDIIFTYKDGSYRAVYLEGPTKGLTLTDVDITGTWVGRISSDGRNLFVSFGVPMKLIINDFGGLEAVCNGVHQGFKIH